MTFDKKKPRIECPECNNKSQTRYTEETKEYPFDYIINWGNNVGFFWHCTKRISFVTCLSCKCQFWITEDGNLI